MRRWIWPIALVVALLMLCVSCTGTVRGTPKPTPTLTHEETLAEYRKVEAEVIKSLGYDPSEVSKGEDVSREVSDRSGTRRDIRCHFCRKGCNLDIEADGFPTYLTVEGTIKVNLGNRSFELNPSDTLVEIKWVAMFCFQGDDSPAIGGVKVSRIMKGWSWDINGVTGEIEQQGNFIVCKDGIGRIISSFEWAICDDGRGGLRVVDEVCPYCPEE